MELIRESSQRLRSDEGRDFSQIKESVEHFPCVSEGRQGHGRLFNTAAGECTASGLDCERLELDT